MSIDKEGLVLNIIIIKNMIEKIKLNLFQWNKQKRRQLLVVKRISIQHIQILINRKKGQPILQNKLKKLRKNQTNKPKNLQNKKSTMMNNVIKNVAKRSNNKKNNDKNKKCNNWKNKHKIERKLRLNNNLVINNKEKMIIEIVMVKEEEEVDIIIIITIINNQKDPIQIKRNMFKRIESTNHIW